MMLPPNPTVFEAGERSYLSENGLSILILVMLWTKKKSKANSSHNFWEKNYISIRQRAFEA